MFAAVTWSCWTAVPQRVVLLCDVAQLFYLRASDAWEPMAAAAASNPHLVRRIFGSLLPLIVTTSCWMLSHAVGFGWFVALASSLILSLHHFPIYNCVLSFVMTWHVYLFRTREFDTCTSRNVWSLFYHFMMLWHAYLFRTRKFDTCTSRNVWSVTTTSMGEFMAVCSKQIMGNFNL